MDCTKLTPKCPQVDNCCLLHIEEILKYTVKLLEEFQINYWIDYNTLKGALEGRVYEDQNAIGFHHKDSDKIEALSHRIYEDGFYLGRINHGANTWLRMHYSYTNSLHVDLLSWNVGLTTVFRNRIYDMSKSCNFDKNYLKPMGSIKLGDTPMVCPNTPEEFIKLRYGA